MYKIDKTQYTTQLGTYQVYYGFKIPVVISGSLPDLYYNQYQAVFDFTQDTARGWVSLERVGTGLKAPLNGLRISSYTAGGLDVYQFAGGETVQVHQNYDTSGNLYVNMYIINQTGAPLALTTQTINFVVDLYDAPVANVA